MRIHTIIALLLLAVPANAQINTEAVRLSRGESGISGSISLLFSVERGNADLTEIELNPDLVWRLGRHQVFWINELSNTSTDGETIVNEGSSHLRYNFDLTQRYVPEVFLQAQYNRSQNLLERYLAGGGLRIVAVSSERYLLAFGVTGMYERERLSSGEITNLARSSNYVSFKITKNDLLSKTTKRNLLSFSTTVYVQPAASDLADLRILLGSEIDVLVIKHLSLAMELQYRHDTEPPQDTKKWDLSIGNGLRFSF